MIVKVGNLIFEPKKGQPIMVILTEQEKEQIRNMEANASMYAQFTADELFTNEEKLAWMRNEIPVRIEGTDDMGIEFVEASDTIIPPIDLKELEERCNSYSDSSVSEDRE